MLNAPEMDEETYRTRAREWLAENLTRRGPETMLDGRRAGETDHQFAARSREIQLRLFEGGYAGITLPVEVGGQGLAGRYQAIFEQESRGYELPGVFGGTFGPVLGTLLGHLSPEDKRSHVTAILRGEELWSQLMSEPGAGSDIGGIGTTALRDGDEWVINGQKVWTTAGHVSDFAMCLTRTDWEATKYAGLTMFVVPLRAAGVTVKPLRQITGSAEFCEVFLDDVRVPAGNVLGEVGGGWAVVQTWLTYEHGGVTKGSEEVNVGTQAACSPIVDSIPRALIDAARATGAAHHPEVRRQLVQLFVDAATQALLSQGMTSAMRSGRLSSHAGSAVKVRSATIAQRGANVAMNLIGPSSIAWESASEDGPIPSETLLSVRRWSIAGGTNEVNLNNVGEKVLGLPREPAVDRNIPYRQVRRSNPGA